MCLACPTNLFLLCVRFVYKYLHIKLPMPNLVGQHSNGGLLAFAREHVSWYRVQTIVRFSFSPLRSNARAVIDR